jgi:hypothetical protein
LQRDREAVPASNLPSWVKSEFYQSFKELTLMILQLFHKYEREGTLPTHITMLVITLIPGE